MRTHAVLPHRRLASMITLGTLLVGTVAGHTHEAAWTARAVPLGIGVAAHPPGTPDACPSSEIQPLTAYQFPTRPDGSARLVQHCTRADLPTPTAVSATGTSTSAVLITWQPGGSTATIHHFEVWRSRAGETVLLASMPLATETSLTDSGLLSNTAYVYRLRAVDPSGRVSSFSPADVATTMVFQEAITPFVTTVKAQHITELQQAVNAVRACAGLPAATWTAMPQPGLGVTVFAGPVQELRTHLTPALTALGLPATWTDDPLQPQSTPIKKVHVQELRDAVK